MKCLHNYLKRFKHLEKRSCVLLQSKPGKYKDIKELAASDLQAAQDADMMLRVYKVEVLQRHAQVLTANIRLRELDNLLLRHGPEHLLETQ